MDNSFCKFPQTRGWDELREHLLSLSGVTAADAIDDPVIGSWIDFAFRGHSFTINTDSGEFTFFTADPSCPEALRSEIIAHVSPFLANCTDYGDGDDITFRRV